MELFLIILGSIGWGLAGAFFSRNRANKKKRIKAEVELTLLQEEVMLMINEPYKPRRPKIRQRWTEYNA